MPRIIHRNLEAYIQRSNPFSYSSLGANKQLTRRELLPLAARASVGARFRTLFSPLEEVTETFAVMEEQKCVAALAI